MFLKASTLLLLPALIVQGYIVKQKTPRLSEPDGERCGIYGQGRPTLSLLILGDSAAAGVGVVTQADALLGQLLTLLSPYFIIEFCLEATTGHTTKQIYQSLERVESRQFDIVISSVGVNDVTSLQQPKTWIKQQKELYQKIQQNFQPKLIIASGVPPMNEFPALPFPLSWLFGQYSAQMNELLAKYIATQKNMQLIQYDLNEYREKNLSMARDGFHPSKEIYQLWAEKIVAIIKTHSNI